MNTAVDDTGKETGNRVSTNNVNWDEMFTHDVIRVKTGQQLGGLGRWLYSDPKTPDDPVRGSSLWTKFLNEHPEYYFRQADFNLAERISKILPDLIGEPVALGFLGVGDAHTFSRKDLKATERFRHVVNLHTIDISQEYCNDATRILAQARPTVTKSTTLKDAFDGFSISLEGASEAKRVVTMFGGTALNVPVMRDRNFKIIGPEREITGNLKSMRKSLSKGDFLVMTHDGNTGPEKVEHAYAGLDEMVSNLAHRIKRDTAYKNIRPENSEFRLEFDRNSTTLLMHLGIDFGNNGGLEELLVQSSPKVEQKTFLEWAKNAKLKSIHSIEDNGVYLNVFEAV